jgi:hypothetical protein
MDRIDRETRSFSVVFLSVLSTGTAPPLGLSTLCIAILCLPMGNSQQGGGRAVNAYHTTAQKDWYSFNSLFYCSMNMRPFN